MNVYQRKESRELHYLLKMWWVARNEPYKKFRRYMRDLHRYVKKHKGANY